MKILVIICHLFFIIYSVEAQPLLNSDENPTILGSRQPYVSVHTYDSAILLSIGEYYLLKNQVELALYYFNESLNLISDSTNNSLGLLQKLNEALRRTPINRIPFLILSKLKLKCLNHKLDHCLSSSIHLLYSYSIIPDEFLDFELRSIEESMNYYFSIPDIESRISNLAALNLFTKNPLIKMQDILILNANHNLSTGNHKAVLKILKQINSQNLSSELLSTLRNVFDDLATRAWQSHDFSFLYEVIYDFSKLFQDEVNIKKSFLHNNLTNMIFLANQFDKAKININQRKIILDLINEVFLNHNAFLLNSPIWNFIENSSVFPDANKNNWEFRQIQKGIGLLKQGDFNSSKIYFNDVLLKNQNSVSALAGLYLSYIKKYDIVNALKTYMTIRALIGEHEWYFILQEPLWKFVQYSISSIPVEQFSTTIKKLLTIAPEYANVLYCVEGYYYLHKNLNHLAKLSFLNAKKKNSKSFNSHLEYPYAGLGLLAFADKNYNVFEKEFSQAIRISQESPYILYLAANSYLAYKPEVAKQLYLKILDYSENQSNVLDYVYGLDNEWVSNAHLQLGSIYFNKKNFTEAYRHLVAVKKFSIDKHIKAAHEKLLLISRFRKMSDPKVLLNKL